MAVNTLRGSPSELSLKSSTALRPRTLVISWISGQMVVVPWGKTPAAKEQRSTMELSTCIWESINPGTRYLFWASMISVFSSTIIWSASPTRAIKPLYTAILISAWIWAVITFTRRPFLIKRSAGILPMATSESFLATLL